MACAGGARAFGEPDTLGRIEVGREADLIVVNLDHPAVAPVHRVPSALVASIAHRSMFETCS